jgi:hypothetical protein
MEEFIATYLLGKGLDFISRERKNIIKDLISIRNEIYDEYVKENQVTNEDGCYPFWGSKIIEQGVVKLLFDKMFSIEDLYEELLDDVKIKFFTKEELETYIQKIYNKISLYPDLATLYGNKIIHSIDRKIDNMPNKFLEMFSGDLSIEFKRQLDVYKKYVTGLKLKTALDLLNNLESAIPKNNKKVLSILYFLKGCCNDYISSGEAFNNYIQAYKWNKDDLLIKQRAIIAYINKDNVKQASIIANDISENHNDYDPYTWLVKTFETNNLALFFSELPQCVLNNSKYRRLIFDFFFKGDSQYYQIMKQYHIIDDDIENIEVICYDNLSLWTYKVNLLFNSYIHGNVLRHFKKAIYTNPILKKLNEACKIVYDFVKDTEIKDNFNQLIFLYYYTQFERTDEKAWILEMDKYPMVYSLPIFVSLYANCKQLIGNFDEALEILEKMPKCSDADFQIKIAIGVKTKNKKLISKTLIQYVSSIDIINNFHVYCILSYADSLPIIKELDKIIQSKEFENLNEKKLWEIYAKLTIDKDKDVKDDLIHLEKVLPNNLKCYIARFYALIGEFEAGARLFDNFLDKKQPSFELDCYLQLLYEGKIRNEELLDLLKYLRENFTPLDNSLLIELELRMQCLDYKEAKIIAEDLYFRFPENENIVSNYIIALVYTDVEKLRELKHDIANFEFKYQDNSINAGNAFLRIGEYKTALDIVYNSAKKRSNTKARLFYLNISANQDVCSYFQDLNVVENHSYVVYLIDGILKKVYIEETELTKITTALLGKRLGDNVEIKDALEHSKTILIMKIMDKYSNLLDDIQIAIQEPISDLPVACVQMPSSSEPDAFIKELISLFGIEGDKRQCFIEEKIKEYKKYKISFFELVHMVGNGDYITTYQNLIANEGIYIAPKQFYQQMNIAKCNENISYALDFTSLLLMFQIYQALRIKPKHKFIVSQLLVNKIEECRYHELLSPSKLGYINITTSGVQVTKVANNYKDNIISFYNKLKSFLDENCDICIVPEKLDFIRRTAKSSSKLEFFLENAMLAMRDNVWLVSDDLGYNKMLKDGRMKIITTEIYLEKLQYGEKVKEIMLHNNYYGLTLSCDIMYKEYLNYSAHKLNYWKNCLLNIECNPFIAEQVVDLTQKICLNSLSTESIIRLELTNIFVSLLRGTGISKIEKIYEMLRHKFHLLPRHIDIVFESFQNALKILNPLL